jgi:transcriptional regulator with XRE-family HTH domain
MSDAIARGRNTRGKRRFKPRLSRVDHGLIERLIEVIDSTGTTNAVALAIGRSEGALRKWRHGQSEPAASDIRRLCEISGYSAEWVLFGTDLQGRCERENRVLEGTVRLRSK